MSARATYGFSIVELMVIIAIVSILATVAVPSYRTYTSRAKFAEIMKIARGAQKEIEEFHTRKARFPNSSSEVKYPITADLGASISGINFVGCSENDQDRFSISLNDNITGDFGQTMIYQASLENDVIIWRCSAGGTNTNHASMLPAACDQDTTSWPTCTPI